jgi:hypothetical protein
VEVNRGKILEEIWNITEYKNLQNLNEFRKNFPTLDFADDVVSNAAEVISMKSYHPLNEVNRTIDNFTSNLRNHLNSLADADLQKLTDIITSKGGNINLVGRDKVLTMVVKQWEWDIQVLQKIADDLIKNNPLYSANGITKVYIKIF